MINVGLSRPRPRGSTGHLPRAPLRLTRVGRSLRAAARGGPPIDYGDGLSTLAASRQKILARCGKLDTHAVP